MPWLSQNNAKRENRFFPFFRIYCQTGSKKREIWVPLESLGQARSVDTPAFFVAALCKPQKSKTEKPFFRICGQTGSGKRVKGVFLESSCQARSVDAPTIPVATLGLILESRQIH